VTAPETHFRLFGAFPLLLFLPSFLSARAAGQTSDAPLRVSGVHVVFFTPSRAERDSIAQAEGLEIDDVIDDFNLSAGVAAVFLGRRGIPSEFTESRFVVVRVGANTFRTFDRRAIEDPTGMILTDGVHEPKIVPGRGTDRDLILQIREYFHLKEENER
jgi:hypothetical protein